MDCITEPLARVACAMQRFMRQRQLRLLQVVTTRPLRLAVLEHIAAGEHHGANRCPFLILEAPVETDSDGWAIRTDELREGPAELPARIGVSHGDAAESPVSDKCDGLPADSPFVRFALRLHGGLHRLPEVLDGLVVVLAPLWVQVPAQWAEHVAALVMRPELGRVRWVVVDLERPACEEVARALGSHAEAVDARVNEAKAHQEVDRMLYLMASAPGNSTGARLCGMPGPHEEPPLRRMARLPSPVVATDEDLASKMAHPLLRREPYALLLRAAKAMREDRPSDAVHLQRHACDTAFAAGDVRESVLFTLVLAGYALQGGAPKAALDLLQAAGQRAEQARLGELAMQAQLALGALLLAEQPAIPVLDGGPASLLKNRFPGASAS